MVCPIHCACFKFEYWRIKALKLLDDPAFEEVRGECTIVLVFSVLTWVFAARAYCEMLENSRDFNTQAIEHDSTNLEMQ